MLCSTSIIARGLMRGLFCPCRRFSPCTSANRALFSLHDLASHLDADVISTHYVPLLSLIASGGLSGICTKLKKLATSEMELLETGLGSIEQLAVSLQSINGTAPDQKGRKFYTFIFVSMNFLLTQYVGCVHKHVKSPVAAQAQSRTG